MLRSNFTRSMALGVLSVLVILGARFIELTTSIASNTRTISGLPDFSGCESMEEWGSSWRPTIVGADVRWSRSFSCGHSLLHVDVGQFVRQEQGKEAVGYENRIFDEGTWRVSVDSVETTSGGDQVKELVLRSGFQEVLVWSWYQINDKRTPFEVEAKLAEAWNAVRLLPSTSTIVTIAMEGDPTDSLRSELRRHAQALHESIHGDVAAYPPLYEVGKADK